MPGGFFRGLAKAVVDGYHEGVAKAEAQAQANTQAYHQNSAQYISPPQSPPHLPQSTPQYGHDRYHAAPDQVASHTGYGSWQNPPQQPNTWTGQYGQHPMTPPFEHNSTSYYPPPQQHQYPPANQPQQGWQNAQEAPSIHSPALTPDQVPFLPAPTQHPPSVVPTTSATPNTDAETQPSQPQLKGSDHCTGEDNTDGPKYCNASIPDMDVCISCYQTHIAATVFGPSFKQVNYPPNSPHTCDMAVHAIRTTWNDAIARTNAHSDPSTHSAQLHQFAQQFTQIRSQITLLIPEAEALTQEIQMLELQQRFQMQSATIQISAGMSMNAIQNSQLSGGVFTNAGSISQDVGNARFADATRMSMQIMQRKMRLQQVAAQVQRIVFGQVVS